MQELEKQLNLTKQSARILNTMQDSQRNAVLLSMAEILESQSEYICQENAKDLKLASALPQAMQKRLELNHSKILAMAQGIRDIVKLPCVVGEIMESWQSKAGLNISKISVPLGVVGVIYESRPNVTSDVAAPFALKAGMPVC